MEKKQLKFLFLVRSVQPYMSNRIDVDYVITHLIKQGVSVDIYDMKRRILLNCNSKKIIKHTKVLKLLDKSPIYLIVNLFYFWRFLLKNKGKYDICHIFFVREEQLILSNLVKKLAPKLYISIYGSDLNIKNYIKNKFKNLYKLSDRITATNQGVLDKLFEENRDFYLDGKSRVLMFPQIRFKNYQDFQIADKQKSKEILGYSNYSKVIIVGTSAADYEQHVKIIDELAKIESQNLLFVFPMTYGVNDYKTYREKIKEYISHKIRNNDAEVLFNYLEEEALSTLRKASDILINLRSNDQLVASMLESLLCHCEIITGSWLPYDVLNEIGITYTRIDRFDQLNDTLKEFLTSETKVNENLLSNNRDIILKKYSFESDLKNWISFYTEDDRNK